MTCDNCAKLQETIDKLKRKLSPLEDPKLTAELSLKLAKIDLMPYKKTMRRGTYIVVTPALISELVFGDPQPTSRQASAIGRSLQAMLWERSALSGDLVYVMPIEEYKEIRP